MMIHMIACEDEPANETCSDVGEREELCGGEEDSEEGEPKRMRDEACEHVQLQVTIHIKTLQQMCSTLYSPLYDCNRHGWKRMWASRLLLPIDAM